MRYNLTLDDDLATHLTKVAKSNGITELELIRKIINKGCPSNLGINSSEFSVIVPKIKKGFIIEIEERTFFFFGFFNVTGDLFSFDGFSEISKKMKKFLKKDEIEGLYRFPYLNGACSCILLNSNKEDKEYLVCNVPGGIPADEINLGTLRPKWNIPEFPIRQEFIVDEEFIKNFFEIKK